MDYSMWTDEFPLRFDENLVWLYERFLVGSVAADVSRLGKNFDKALGITTSSYATSFLSFLSGDGLKIVFKDKIEEVEQDISLLAHANPKFWEVNELFVCHRTKNQRVVEIVQSLREYQENEQSGLGDESNELVARRFFEVDSVFRHIRNSLAHGCVRTFEVKSNVPSVFLFDMNKQGELTAAISLSFARLRSWYQELCRLAKSEL